MEDAFLPYVDDDCLREVHHMYNTQLNESLNRSFSKFAPKDKTFSKSQSLFGRMNIVSGRHNIGRRDYWLEVYTKLGLTPSLYQMSYLHRVEKKYQQKSKREKTIKHKRKRKKKHTDHLIELKKENDKAKKDGCDYGSGIALSGKGKKKGKKTKVIDETKKCSSCGMLGHSRRTNKACLNYQLPAKKRKRE